MQEGEVGIDALALELKEVVVFGDFMPAYTHAAGTLGLPVVLAVDSLRVFLGLTQPRLVRASMHSKLSRPFEFSGKFGPQMVESLKSMRAK